jgi:hypothetical protein
VSAGANFITVASGLPRSGTSLVMQMLQAGGVPILTDQLRQPDENNPRGYFEYAPVKHLRSERSWLAEARGKAVKIIHFLLPELPTDGSFEYRVVLIQRPLAEVLASQRAMLEREGKTSADEQMLAKAYAAQLSRVNQWLDTNPCFRTLRLEHARLLHESREAAAEIQAFLELRLDLEKMAAVVDPTLYRQRAKK